MDLASKNEPLEKFPNHPSSDTHLLLSFTNGALKRHHPHHHHHHRLPKSLYKECLKNHAAALGGHAIDGCGEFMPSPHSSPADPTSLKCAACGCHRNFHRKSDDTDEEEEDDEDDAAAAAHFTPKRRNSSSPPHPLASAYSPSAPQMLLALSAGQSGPPPDADGHQVHSHHGGNRPATPNATPVAVRKRFRTKFTREQKEKMYEFAEMLGWRMQRQDEGRVEEFCREIGVGKSVLKVWMHNHKNSFTKRNSTTPSSLPESNHHASNDNNTTNNGNAADNSAALNASSSSS